MGRFDYVLGVFFSLLSVHAATPGFAQSTFNGRSSLTGTVFAEGSDQRIAHASVILCDNQGNSVQEAAANEAGEFSFNGIRAEHYIVRVRAEGFETAEVRVDLVLGSQRGISVTLKAAHKAASGVPDRRTISAHELAMPEAAQDLMTSGKRKLYQEKNAKAALSDFQSATARAPKYYEAYYQAGMAYLMLRKEAEAEEQFRKSVEVSQKKYGDADIALATILLQRNDVPGGEPLLREGLALNPQSWPGQIELGKLELSRGHIELALAAAEKAESLAPLQPMVYRLLSLVHLRAKDYSALMADLDAYIRLDPDSPAGVRAKELRAQMERQLPKSQGQEAAVNE